MSKDEVWHQVSVSDAGKKKLDRAAALLGLDDFTEFMRIGLALAIFFAEEYVKGKTEVIYVTPEFNKLFKNNPEFFDALCQEGVIEWLTPLVLAKAQK
jgi:hypothetical protein